MGLEWNEYAYEWRLSSCIQYMQSMPAFARTQKRAGKREGQDMVWFNLALALLALALAFPFVLCVAESVHNL